MSTAKAIPYAPSLQVVATKPATTPRVQFDAAIGYLRAFVTLLVLAHHAVLAYHPFAPPPPASLTAAPRLWQAFPVVDSHHWSGFTMFVGFNDAFFMSLMFFLSGLFVWSSLQRKGAGNFVRDRLLRLGVPFLAAAALLAPLAYYPAYLQTGGTGWLGFWRQWFSLGNWPAGPAWFIWVLLAFDCVAAGLFQLWPKFGDAISRISANASRRPAAFFGKLLLLSAAAYIPMAHVFTVYRWSAFGPFTFQTARILHYLVYFLMGIGIGAFGLGVQGNDRGLLTRGGNLAKRWWLWLIAAPLAFGLAAVAFILALMPHSSPLPWEVFMDSTFVLSCATSSFACLALFVRFMSKRGKIWDSLTANAYGMYLIHYVFVSWLQYALLRSSLPGIAKGSLVFLGTLALSWSVTAALRRIPALARVI
jgi:peptidoglycan/LPS O-acetylase OafA/YrhL